MVEGASCTSHWPAECVKAGQAVLGDVVPFPEEGSVARLAHCFVCLYNAWLSEQMTASVSQSSLLITNELLTICVLR